jgi:hypothetical protein
VVGNDCPVVLVDQVIVNDLEVAVRVDEYFRRVKGHKRPQLAECVGTRLKDTPKLCFLEIFDLLLSCLYFLLQCYLRIFKNGIYFKGS